jgi:hypothetical protein
MRKFVNNKRKDMFFILGSLFMIAFILTYLIVSLHALTRHTADVFKIDLTTDAGVVHFNFDGYSKLMENLSKKQ